MRRSHQLIRTYTLQLATVGLLSAAANAQFFNVDFNDPLNPLDCASTYAAAGSAGVWNSINMCAGAPFSLVDKSGAATSVTMNASGGMFGCWSFPNPAYIGEDANLMQDMTYGGPGAFEWIEFSGLNNGTYIVYTYAVAPNIKSDLQGVDCTESTDGIQNVGGAWPGSHQHGVSYARHTAIVTNGTLHIDVSTVNGSWPSLNGFQIEPGSLGSNYCAVNANSTGAPAIMDADGSLSIVDNNLTIGAQPVPTQPGIFFYADNQSQIPFGEGFLCAIGTIIRFSPGMPTGDRAERAVDLPSAGITTAGTLNFQYWFRDPAGGGTFFNTSDGLELIFTP